MNSAQLWNTRWRLHLQKVLHYLAVSGSSLFYGFICTFGVVGYYYAKLLRASPPAVGSMLCLIAILSWALTSIRVRTFLQEPDVIFLLPLEVGMKPYFQRSVLFGCAVHSLRLLAAALIAAPLHLHLDPDAPLILQLSFLIALQIWNVYVSWITAYSGEAGTQLWSNEVRFCLNAAVVYFLLQGAYLYIGVLFLLMAILLAYVRANQPALVPWEYLLRQEQQLDLRFYRFINLFMDVPQVMKKVKPRQVLSIPIRAVLEKQRRPYLYLYGFAFLRANDYLGLYMRLTGIGLLLLVYMPGVYGKAAVFLIFSYAAFLQILPLWRHFHSNSLLDLYPLTTEERRRSFLQVLAALLLGQQLLFTIAVSVTVGQIGKVAALAAAGLLLLFLLLGGKRMRQLSA